MYTYIYISSYILYCAYNRLILSACFPNSSNKLEVFIEPLEKLSFSCSMLFPV